MIIAHYINPYKAETLIGFDLVISIDEVEAYRNAMTFDLPVTRPFVEKEAVNIAMSLSESYPDVEFSNETISVVMDWPPVEGDK